MRARSVSGFKRFSLASCTIFISIYAAYVYSATLTETPSADYEKGYILTPADSQGAKTITKYVFNKETNKLEPVYY